jgi:predicted metal-dependent phosphotriesterase family hydrolase
MNHIRFYGGSEWKNIKAERSLPPPKQGLTAVGEDGRLLPEVVEVLEAAAKYDVCVATGHLAVEESAVLCREALRRGVKKIVLTHVDFETQKVPLNLQTELAAEGVMIEKTALAAKWGHISVEDMARSIVHLGPEHCILATDYGQADNLAVPEGFSKFLSSLLDCGVKQDALETMIKHNPRKILGLE